ncbi:MAG: hypothetical protein LC768_17075 [Acidobacteria bacterium]|nr:hypothetical protein [Acidobacteriota bacterium]MCA1640007.1 hypothetical protein [Acidobacteriota bacterium]
MKGFSSLLVISMFIAGCSSAPTVTNTTANRAKPVNNSQLVNANVETAGNSTNVNVPTNDPFKNLKGGKFPNPNRKPGGIDMKNVKVVTPTSSAPDNSVVSATMNTEGLPIETRAFKNHPILLKVEKIFVDIKNPNTRVFLKNGKVVDLPPGKISDASIAPADEILRAAGIAPKSAPQKDVSGKKENEAPQREQ